MRIEFIEGEPFCRFDGVLVTPEYCKELYGYEGEVDILDHSTYLIDGVIYSDQKLGKIIKFLGRIEDPIEEYDFISSQGMGYESHSIRKEYENSLIIRLGELDNLESIKPFKELKKDYPKLDIKKYMEFMNCLDEFYENKIN